MNPRILKKLSKLAITMGVGRNFNVHLEDEHCNTGEYAPRRASRKLSHREQPRSWEEPYRDGKPRLGDMFVLKGTPWLCWADHGPDGTDHESAVAWPWLEQRIRGEIDWAARDLAAPLAVGEWEPPYRNGQAPRKLNTWELIRAMRESLARERARRATYVMSAMERRKLCLP